jgi:hypothetical protein
MTTRKYSSRSQQTTLTASLNTSATSTTVVSASALLGGATISAGETFTVVIDADTALEEIVDVTAVSTNTLTIARGIENNGTGVAHSAGAIVRHMAIGRDFREANEHIENVTTAHGLTIANVITTTNTKTLTNKTLTSPTITGATISGGTVTGLSSPTSGGDAATKTYVDAILGSATAASTSATSAATSASSAATSASSAATSASAAATSATSAQTSASAAATSATNAATSATSAQTFATNAATSASSAATSASNAAAYDISAQNWATKTDGAVAGGEYSAKYHAQAAVTSATSAATSASSAATSATSAATSATSAANSLTSVTGLTGSGLVRDMGAITESDTTTTTYINVSTLLSSAETSASSAATSASSAATSASSSATQATAAATSATSAAASATSAAASYDSFDDRYLGAKSSAPSVDNDGNALITGALYFNSTTPGMYVWTGSAWNVMATSGDIESVTAGTGLSGGGTAGAVTVSLNTSSVYVVPTQATHNGKFLTTDGSTASWVSISDWGSI